MDNFSLGEVSGKLDSLIIEVREIRQEMREALKDQAGRLSVMEQWRSRMTGVAAGAGAVVSGLFYVLFSLI